MVLESRAGRFAALAAVLIAVFSSPLVRASAVRLLLSPGYDDDALVTIDRDTVHHNSGYGTVRPSVMELWRAKAQSFRVLLPLERWTSPEGLHTERISDGTMALTGVSPWRGRLFHFSPEREAVASYEWAQRNSAHVGDTVRLGYRPFTITGIMPPRFRLLSRDNDFWMALPADAKNLEFVGSLKPGISSGAATAELREFSRRAHHWGTRKLEVITLQRNRRDDLYFSLSVLFWNLVFIAVLIARGWWSFLTAPTREITIGQHARFLGFLFLKTTVALLPLVLMWILFVDPQVQQYFTGFSGWSIPVFFWAYLLAAWGLTFWSLNDQRNRCRKCLQHLRMPVNRGSWSSLVINRPATESICTYGHGTLYVPGTHLLNLDSVSWRSNHDMWDQLAV